MFENLVRAKKAKGFREINRSSFKDESMQIPKKRDERPQADRISVKCPNCGANLKRRPGSKAECGWCGDKLNID